MRGFKDPLRFQIATVGEFAGRGTVRCQRPFFLQRGTQPHIVRWPAVLSLCSAEEEWLRKKATEECQASCMPGKRQARQVRDRGFMYQHHSSPKILRWKKNWLKTRIIYRAAPLVKLLTKVPTRIINANESARRLSVPHTWKQAILGTQKQKEFVFELDYPRGIFSLRGRRDNNGENRQ